MDCRLLLQQTTTSDLACAFPKRSAQRLSLAHRRPPLPPDLDVPRSLSMFARAPIHAAFVLHRRQQTTDPRPSVSHQAPPARSPVCRSPVRRSIRVRLQSAYFLSSHPLPLAFSQVFRPPCGTFLTRASCRALENPSTCRANFKFRIRFGKRVNALPLSSLSTLFSLLSPLLEAPPETFPTTVMATRGWAGGGRRRRRPPVLRLSPRRSRPFLLQRGQ